MAIKSIVSQRLQARPSPRIARCTLRPVEQVPGTPQITADRALVKMRGGSACLVGFAFGFLCRTYEGRG
jgi:hypothetical protein